MPSTIRQGLSNTQEPQGLPRREAISPCPLITGCRTGRRPFPLRPQTPHVHLRDAEHRYRGQSRVASWHRQETCMSLRSGRRRECRKVGRTLALARATRARPHCCEDDSSRRVLAQQPCHTAEEGRQGAEPLWRGENLSASCRHNVTTI